jgi:hypothetical protein
MQENSAVPPGHSYEARAKRATEGGAGGLAQEEVQARPYLPTGADESRCDSTDEVVPRGEPAAVLP